MVCVERDGSLTSRLKKIKMYARVEVPTWNQELPGATCKNAEAKQKGASQSKEIPVFISGPFQCAAEQTNLQQLAFCSEAR